MKAQRCSSGHRGLAYLPSVDSWTFQQEEKSHPWGIQRGPIKAHIRCTLSLSCSAPSFSVCCTPPASLTFLEKKKIRVATFHHAGDALKDLKKINVSFKRSVRISSGDGTRCQKRHLCCVTHTVSWSLCLFTSKGRCGIWGWCGWGETVVRWTWQAPMGSCVVLDTLIFPLPKVAWGLKEEIQFKPLAWGLAPGIHFINVS